MSRSRLLAVAVDAIDPATLARFWADALGLEVGEHSTDAHGTTYVAVPRPDGPGLLFQQVGDVHPGRNRLHLDLTVTDGTGDEEIERLTGFGARIVDPAPDHPWVVLADPEDNLFCVLGPR